jgi:hypothetical protein
MIEQVRVRKTDVRGGVSGDEYRRYRQQVGMLVPFWRTVAVANWSRDASYLNAARLI